ncbi:alpha/beta hydrolase [Nocardiopsis kunsanensis]|uniref:Alpha/beta hydrolase n=1 Tax=Nocardiopsis kunsanensis TaxID=141693 RepID=A0A918XBA0_9ACTN|nr:alpha/beta hydrolase [Nocardiopsis kunsanensis]GHD21797.1 alpha/beta hydrolase [Nocardiopsis kunsanensis]
MSERPIHQEALADLADVPAVGRWFRSGGLRLHALDYGALEQASGAGERPSLLILPGITSPAISMDFVARRLTDVARPVVVDLRGRGLSDAPDDGDYSLDAYADDVEAAVEGLGLGRTVLLGHSLGARIAAAAAVRPGAAYTGSILVDPPMSGPGRAPYPTTLEAFRKQLQQAQRGTDAEEVAAFWPRWSLRERELRARWLASCATESIDATHRGFEAEDFFDYWGSVPQPTTLVYGADSPVVDAAGVKEAAEAHPGAELVGVEGAGHMIFWDAPEGAMTAVRESLASMPKA